MKKSIHSAPARIIDNKFSIRDIFSEPKACFDFVVGTLNGDHGERINHVSERAYYILSGQAIVCIGECSIDANAGDFFYIPKNTNHGISGHCEFIIITSPPLSAGDETETRKAK